MLLTAKKYFLRKIVPTLGLSLIWASTPLLAATYSLEKITVPGVEQSDKKLDTTLSVGVIHSEQLKEDIPVTITEAIDDIPGVSLTSPAGSLFQNPIVRGLGGKRIVMLQDGHLLSSERSIGVTGYFLEMSDVERMEITKGPGSVLYGSGALSGIVNIYTQDPLETKGIKSMYGFQYDDKGDSNTNILSTAYGNKKLGLKFIGRTRQAQDYQTASGQKIVNSHFKDQSLTAKTSYQMTDRQKIKLYLSQYDGDDIGKAWTPEDDQGFQLKRTYFPYDKHFIYNGQYEIKKLGIFNSVSMYAQYRQSNKEQRIDQYTSIDTSNPDYYTQKIYDTQHLSGKVVGELIVNQNSFVTMGVDHNYKKLNMTEDKFDWLSNPMIPQNKTLVKVSAAVPYDGATYNSLGIFETSEHYLDEHNVLSTGLRYDTVTTRYPYEDGSTSAATDHSLSGNIGYLYSQTKAFNFTVNIGRAFRAPEIDEKFMDQRTCKGLFFGNADLKPETSLNIDMGIKGELPRNSYEAYLYANHISNFIGVIPYEGQVRPYGYWDYGYKYVNISKARLLGGELSLSHSIPLTSRGLWLKISNQLSYVNGRDTKKKEDLAQIPPVENTVKFRLSHKKHRKLKEIFAESSIRYIAPKDKINSSDTNFTPVTDQKTPSVILYGLRLGVKTKELAQRYSMDAFLNIGNITNKAFRYFLDPIESAGRNLKLGLTVNF